MATTYKIFNKTYQPVILTDGKRLAKRTSVIVEKLTNQIKNLEKKGMLSIKKITK